MWVSWCKNKFFWQRFTCTDIEIKEEPLETIVENYVGASEIKLEQSEELYDPLNVTSVHKEKKLLKCDVGSKNGNRQVRCFCKVYLSCTNTLTNPLDFLSIHQKEKQVKKEYKLRQGLLYLDGRNSQKYLHQTQADFWTLILLHKLTQSL